MILNSGEYNNIFNRILYPFISGINFLNYLYQKCRTIEDYNKLLNLTSKILLNKEIHKNICISELFLYKNELFF